MVRLGVVEVRGVGVGHGDEVRECRDEVGDNKE